MAEGDAKYFVEGDDGQRYGPADVATLRQWIAEGRLHPTTVLIDVATQARVNAIQVPGLFVTAGPPPRAEQPGYQQPPYQPARRGSSPVVIVVVVILCVCGFGTVFLAAILFPVFAQARVAATRTRGLSHMKELALSAMMYTNDNNDAFPPHMESAIAAQPALMPYAKSTAIFKSINPAGGEILGNPKLDKRKITDIASPEYIVMFYDSKPWSGRRGMAAYADGHTTLSYDFAIIGQSLKYDPKKPQDGSSSP